MVSMRSLLIFVAIACCANYSFAQKKGESRNEIDLKKSRVEWTGKKMTGEHYGEISISQGYLVFSKARLTSGHFEMDMNSITCTDITDEKENKRLVDHLKSDDFFSASKFPHAKFEITSAAYKSENSYLITGNLSIKGKANTLSFPATVTSGNGVTTAKATMVFDRSKYDIKFGSQSFFENLGDKLVYDDIEIKVELVLMAK
jgi:polyisoprenoid-binding protein YceI